MHTQSAAIVLFVVSVAAPVAAQETAAPPGEASAPEAAEGERPSDPAAERPVAEKKMVFEPGKGIRFESEDGDFAITTRLRAQFLYTLEHDGEAPPEEDAARHAFEVRRARLRFQGHVFGEHNKYNATFAFSPRDMGMRDGVATRTPLLDWYGELDYLRDLTVRFGQYKVPYNRVRVLSSAKLELVDRSIANAEFNLDRDIGFDLRSTDFLGLGHLRYHAGIFLNAGRDAHELKSFGMMYLARVEVLPFGGADERWDYEEADLSRDPEPRLSLGFAYAFLDDAENDQGILGSPPLDEGTTDFHNVTADAFFKVAGFSASAEFYWRKGARTFGDATFLDDAGNEIPQPQVPPRNGLGYYLQLGYVVPVIPFQVAARYGHVVSLGRGTQTSLPGSAEIGGGVSYYFAEHPLKLQADYFRVREDTFDPKTFTFAQETWARGIDRFRLQLQLAY